MWTRGIGAIIWEGDLNRDWGYFRQEETRLIERDLAKTVNASVEFAIDFLSTFQDVFYVLEPGYRNLKDDKVLSWIRAFSKALPERSISVKTVAHKVYHSTSMYWLASHYKTPAVVYEWR